jgi:hypothetical protein
MIKNINQFVRTTKSEYLILSFVLVLGFAVRLYKIGNPIADWHSWRQADTASVSKIYVEKGINLFFPKYHDVSSVQTGKPNPEGFRMVEFPVYNGIHAILFGRIPIYSLEVWGRLLTIFCSLASALFLYLIGKRFLGGWGGVLAASFFLFIPFNIYFSRVILPDPMGVAFGVAALWLFIKFIDSEKDWFLYLSATFFALMLLIKPYLGFYFVPAMYLVINKYGLGGIFKNKQLIIKAGVFIAISLLPFAAWRIWESRFPEGIPFYTWAFNGNHIRFKPSFWYWIFGERLGHLILGSLGLIPFAFGVLHTKVKNYFIHWFAIGAFAYVAIVADANTMHDYYQILIMPAVALILALGSVYLWNQEFFNKVLARSVLIFSVGVMLLTGRNQIFGNYNVNHPEIIEAGRVVDQIAPKDALVVAPYNGDTAFLYQTNRSGWPAIEDSIDNIIKRGAGYYVSVDLSSPDTKAVAARYKTIKLTDKYILVDLTKPIAK